MTDFAALFGALAGADVEFVLVGGVAATVHGSTRLTQDVDVVYRRTEPNLRRIEKALAPFRPYPRGAPEGLPFEWSWRMLKGGLNFTLTTGAGFIDLLGEVAGGGTYERLATGAEPVELFGYEVLCVDLDTLISLKRAAGRPRDYEAVAELEAIREERGG